MFLTEIDWLIAFYPGILPWSQGITLSVEKTIPMLVTILASPLPPGGGWSVSSVRRVEDLIIGSISTTGYKNRWLYMTSFILNHAEFQQVTNARASVQLRNRPREVLLWTSQHTFPWNTVIHASLARTRMRMTWGPCLWKEVMVCNPFSELNICI